MLAVCLSTTPPCLVKLRTASEVPDFTRGWFEGGFKGEGGDPYFAWAIAEGFMEILVAIRAPKRVTAWGPTWELSQVLECPGGGGGDGEGGGRGLKGREQSGKHWSLAPELKHWGTKAIVCMGKFALLGERIQVHKLCLDREGYAECSMVEWCNADGTPAQPLVPLSGSLEATLTLKVKCCTPWNTSGNHLLSEFWQRIKAPTEGWFSQTLSEFFLKLLS